MHLTFGVRALGCTPHVHGDAGSRGEGRLETTCPVRGWKAPRGSPTADPPQIDLLETLMR